MDAKHNPSEWPSIARDDALDLGESTDVLETSADPDRMIESSSLDQTPKANQKISENFNSTESSDYAMVAQEESSVIPDLPLAEKPAENQNQLNDQELASDHSALIDSSSELGDLRFAGDGD